MRNLTVLLVLCLSFHANAALIVWEFEVEILELEDQLNLFPNFNVGDTFTGFFGYNDNIQQTNTSTYVNSFESDSLIFGLDFTTNINSILWVDQSVQVTHQGGRDIVDFEMERDTGYFASELELGYLDNSAPYAQGQLPLNWHALSDFAYIPEFEFTAKDNMLGLTTEIYGEFTSIHLRESVSVAEPAVIWIIVPLTLFLLVRRRLT